MVDEPKNSRWANCKTFDNYSQVIHEYGLPIYRSYEKPIDTSSSYYTLQDVLNFESLKNDKEDIDI